MFETTRRELLKLAGYSASATLLSGMLEQIAVQASGTEKLPRRVVFFVQSNGMNPNHLRPEGVIAPKNGKMTNDTLVEYSLKDRKLHKAFEALSPFQEKLTFVQGLSGCIARSDHSANHGCLGAYPANKGPMLQTIDSAMAEALPRGIFRHVLLGLGGRPDTTMNYSLSAEAAGKANPIVCSPALAFKSLFGSVSEGEGRTAFQQKTNLLEFMKDDVRRVSNSLTGEDKEKLDQYLQAFENLHTRQQELLAKAEILKKNAPKLGDKLKGEKSSLILESQMEIAAAALISGLTNCITFASGGGGQQFGSFPEFNLPDLHGVGHGNAYGRTSSDECFVELRQFHVKLIAQLAKKLQDVKEGDGTMLDNTLIVYLSDSGESHHPNLREWPVVLLGNLGGKLKTNGRYLEFPCYESKNHRTMAALYCTFLHAAGKPRDKFGVADPAYKLSDQSGVVKELLA